ncbi:MAG TPA: FtsX-like permease family protein [Puia sp.]|nr:FtsX-like permease family protein [Puia sp.]
MAPPPPGKGFYGHYRFWSVPGPCAGLGIFGLVTAATEQRTKELGIRKVLGARVIHLVLLLLKDYGLAISLAVLIALPAGGWVMHNWLQGFAYRTVLHPWLFIAAPLCAIGLAVVIVGLKARSLHRNKITLHLV